MPGAGPRPRRGTVSDASGRRNRERGAPQGARRERQGGGGSRHGRKGAEVPPLTQFFVFSYLAIRPRVRRISLRPQPRDRPEMYLPENDSQMRDILSELRVYAAQNALPRLAEQIDDALLLLLSERLLPRTGRTAAPCAGDGR